MGILVIILMMGCMPAQAQGLKGLLNGLKDGVSSLVNKVTVNESTILGKWNYSQPACTFESENLLAQAGGTVASAKVEEELTGACKKLGIKSTNTSFEFKSDGTYVQTIGGKSTSGTYTFDKDKLAVVMTGRLGFSTTAYVTFSGDEMKLTYDASKVLSLAKGVVNEASKFADSSILTIFNAVSTSYDGMRLGFELKK